MTIDLDSTICEVHGKAKQGAAYGYTRMLGYHPLLATRADTGEVLHARLRKGSTQRGAKRFVEELIARVRRAGATGPLTVRADAGFWNYELIDTLTRLGVRLVDHGPHQPSIRKAIDAIDETAWTDHRLPRRRPGPGRRVHVRDRQAGTDASCGWSCAALASPTAPKRGCGPTGATTRSSPTSNCPPSKSTSSTATTPGRARHPRPERRRRARTLPLRPVLRQCRLAGLRRARPQPHALDRPTRRHAPHRTTHRRPHLRTRLLELPGRLVNRSRQGRCGSRTMAMGQRVHHRARPHPPLPLVT